MTNQLHSAAFPGVQASRASRLRLGALLRPVGRALLPVLASTLVAGSVIAATATAVGGNDAMTPPSAGEFIRGSATGSQAVGSVQVAMHEGRGHRHHARANDERGDRGMRRLFRGLDLTEAQRDQLFEIRHREMPTMREQRKQLRAAREALRQASFAPGIDAATLTDRAEQVGRITSAIAQSRARTMVQALAVLTDAQRATVQERMEARGGGDHQEGRGRHRS